MARNKYPEETIQKILDIAFHLFSTKGYEKTSIQDIVNDLGMSKGAIYHHFKSKEEILYRMCERFYSDNAWLERICGNSSMDGLEKLRQLFLYQLGNRDKVALDAISMSLQADPHMMLESLKTAVYEVAPIMAELIREGVADGSMHAKDPTHGAQVMIVLVNVWLNPGLFPVEKSVFCEKVALYQEILSSIGIPLMDDRLLKTVENYYDTVMNFQKRNQDLNDAMPSPPKR